MITRGLGFAIGFLSLAASASAQVLTLPEGTTGLTPIAGDITEVQSVRVPLGDAIMGSETQVTLEFTLQGCLDSLMPLISHYEVEDEQATIYVTALNAHNEESRVANCIAMPQVTEQVSVPGIFQPDQIDVVFLGQSKTATQTQATYMNERFNFRFRYPSDLALDTSREVVRPQRGDTLRSQLSLWPQAVYDKIQAGDYEGGAEYPPDLSISVHRTPRNQSLAEWAEGYQPGIQNVQPIEVAGQPGISYQADGLYPSDNVAFYSPDRQLIHLSASYLDPNDSPLRDAFPEVVSSFEFVR